MTYLNELVRLLRGFVKIRVSGEYADNFINVCVNCGFSIWGIEKCNDEIYMYVGMKNFLQIRGLKRKIKGKIKIKLIEKHGLPIYFQRYKKRMGLIFGLAIFLLINIFLSQFIWDIKVCGNETIDETEIVNTCNEIGINLGVHRKNIDTYNAKQIIALKFDEIAWVSLNIEGSRVTVNISEANALEHGENPFPRNIVANIDGVIKSMKVVKGQKCVTIGQAVKKGDVLVSGVVDNVVSSHMVAAEGEIIAQTERCFSFETDKKYKFENIINKEIHRDVFEFFWLKTPLFLNGVNGNFTSELTRNPVKLFGENLPIGITRRTYHPIVVQEKVLTKEEAERLARSNICELLKDVEINEVLNSEINIYDNKDTYKIEAKVICLENIVEYTRVNTDGY